MMGITARRLNLSCGVCNQKSNRIHHEDTKDTKVPNTFTLNFVLFVTFVVSGLVPLASRHRQIMRPLTESLAAVRCDDYRVAPSAKAFAIGGNRRRLADEDHVFL